MPMVTTSVLDRVRDRSVLRVGYFDDSLPYAFVNQRGELVGFDIEMAQQLAQELGVQLELVPVSRAVLESGLDTSACDLVMSGVAVTADRATRVLYSSAYLDETIAFIVPDHLARSFSEWEDVRAMRSLRIGAPRAPYFTERLRSELGDVEIVPFDRVGDVFEMLARSDQRLDAVVATAERGSAYTLLHPEYSVVVPKPRTIKVPLAYLVAGRDQPMAALVNAWIELKRKDGTIDELFAHWILGQDASPRAARWSVMDNVLSTSK
jgi:ABC-type amino acid transport substrate-binding protein